MLYKSYSESETEAIGFCLAKNARPGVVYCLRGELGAGKTVFARGFARGLGIVGKITSPTFCIVNEYMDGTLPLYHFDAYRVNAAGMLDIGFWDYIYGQGVCLIEWADNVEGLIPGDAVWIEITCAEGVRYVNISD